jgi:pimeloyl-ACP methyl ester carboxylesterase
MKVTANGIQIEVDVQGPPQGEPLMVSMGGMIAQHMAAAHPTRVRSLTLIMTSSGARQLPQPRMKTRQALLSRPRSAEVADVVAHLEALIRVIGSPGYPSDPARQRQRLEAAVRGAWRPAGTARQMLAIVADGDRSPLLAKIRVPTRVVHGADDPLVPPAAAPDLVAKIRGATLDLVPGMGHDLPLALLPRLADNMAEVARRAGSAPAAPDQVN